MAAELVPAKRVVDAAGHAADQLPDSVDAVLQNQQKNKHWLIPIAAGCEVLRLIGTS